MVFYHDFGSGVNHKKQRHSNS